MAGLADGQPAIFDPAAYYGHHEAEFGMSWCAGRGRGQTRPTIVARQEVQPICNMLPHCYRVGMTSIPHTYLATPIGHTFLATLFLVTPACPTWPHT